MRPLRLGIMCYGTTLASWEAQCVLRLLARKDVEVALLIVEPKPALKRLRRSLFGRVKTLFFAPSLFWRLYERFFVNGRVTALHPVDLAVELASVPNVDCETVRKGRYSEYFTPDDIALIRQYDLDIVLRFAFGIIRGEILTAPRYGVWSFHHDDETRYRGGPPGFWEIYFHDPVSGAILQRLTDRLDGGIVLRRGLFETVAGSYVRNRDRALFGGVDWPAEVCRDIREGIGAYVDGPPSLSSAPVFRAPTNLQMLWFLLSLGISRVRSAISDAAILN